MMLVVRRARLRRARVRRATLRTDTARCPKAFATPSLARRDTKSSYFRSSYAHRDHSVRQVFAADLAGSIFAARGPYAFIQGKKTEIQLSVLR